MAPSAWCVPLGPSTHLEGVSAHRDAEPKDKSRGWGRPGGACGGIQFSPPPPHLLAQGHVCALIVGGRQDFPAGGPLTASSDHSPSSVFWGVGCSLGTGWDGGLGTKAAAPGDARAGPAVAAGLQFPLCAEAGPPGQGRWSAWEGVGRLGGLCLLLGGGPRDSRSKREPLSCCTSRPGGLPCPPSSRSRSLNHPSPPPPPHLEPGPTTCWSLCSMPLRAHPQGLPSYSPSLVPA